MNNSKAKDFLLKIFIKKTSLIGLGTADPAGKELAIAISNSGALGFPLDQIVVHFF